MRVGLELPEVIESIEEHWLRLSKATEVRK